VGVITVWNFSSFHFYPPHPRPLPRGERRFPDENYLKTWQQERDLGTDLIFRTDLIGSDHIVIGAELSVKRNLSNPEDFPHGSSQWHGPPLVGFRLPVGRDDR